MAANLVQQYTFQQKKRKEEEYDAEDDDDLTFSSSEDEEVDDLDAEDVKPEVHRDRQKRQRLREKEEKAKKRDKIREKKRRRAVLAHLTPEQQLRYENFIRSTFNKGKVKEIMKSALGHGRVSKRLVYLMSALAKVFVGEVVEESRQVMAELRQPDHSESWQHELFNYAELELLREKAEDRLELLKKQKDHVEAHDSTADRLFAQISGINMEDDEGGEANDDDSEDDTSEDDSDSSDSDDDSDEDSTLRPKKRRKVSDSGGKSGKHGAGGGNADGTADGPGDEEAGMADDLSKELAADMGDEKASGEGDGMKVDGDDEEDDVFGNDDDDFFEDIFGSAATASLSPTEGKADPDSKDASAGGASAFVASTSTSSSAAIAPTTDEIFAGMDEDDDDYDAPMTAAGSTMPTAATPAVSSSSTLHSSMAMKSLPGTGQTAQKSLPTSQLALATPAALSTSSAPDTDTQEELSESASSSQAPPSSTQTQETDPLSQMSDIPSTQETIPLSQSDGPNAADVNSQQGGAISSQLDTQPENNDEEEDDFSKLLAMGGGEESTGTGDGNSEPGNSETGEDGLNLADLLAEDLADDGASPAATAAAVEDCSGSQLATQVDASAASSQDAIQVDAPSASSQEGTAHSSPSASQQSATEAPSHSETQREYDSQDSGVEKLEIESKSDGNTAEGTPQPDEDGDMDFTKLLTEVLDSEDNGTEKVPTDDNAAPGEGKDGEDEGDDEDEDDFSKMLAASLEDDDENSVEASHFEDKEATAAASSPSPQDGEDGQGEDAFAALLASAGLDDSDDGDVDMGGGGVDSPALVDLEAPRSSPPLDAAAAGGTAVGAEHEEKSSQVAEGGKIQDAAGDAPIDFAELLSAEGISPDGAKDAGEDAGAGDGDGAGGSEPVLMDLVPPRDDAVDSQSLTQSYSEQKLTENANVVTDISSASTSSVHSELHASTNTDSHSSAAIPNGAGARVPGRTPIVSPQHVHDGNAMQDDSPVPRISNTSVKPASAAAVRPPVSQSSSRSSGQSTTNGTQVALRVASAPSKPEPAVSSSAQPSTSASSSSAAMKDIDEPPSAPPIASPSRPSKPAPAGDLASDATRAPILTKSRRYLGAIRPGHIREAHRRVRARGCGGRVRFFGLDDPSLTGGSKGGSGSYGAARSIFKW